EGRAGALNYSGQATFNISQCIVVANQAVGGAGGAGGNGGKWLGGGVRINGGPSHPPVSFIPVRHGVRRAPRRRRERRGRRGGGGGGGRAGRGGGGVFNTPAGTVGARNTLITGNVASTSDDDVFGDIDWC